MVTSAKYTKMEDKDNSILRDDLRHNLDYKIAEILASTSKYREGDKGLTSGSNRLPDEINGQDPEPDRLADRSMKPKPGRS